MDAIVEAALRKWPNVPHCYRWLALDARGDWYMRDDRTQAAGPFPRSKGSRIEHDKLRQFIGRNYGHDAAGAWYFQNGPQRVYIDLEAAPWVWRLSRDEAARASTEGADGAEVIVTSHTGLRATLGDVLVDEAGRVFLATDLGPGIVHTLDMNIVADAVEHGAWRPADTTFAAIVSRFGYRLEPAGDQTPAAA